MIYLFFLSLFVIIFVYPIYSIVKFIKDIHKTKHQYNNKIETGNKFVAEMRERIEKREIQIRESLKNDIKKLQRRVKSECPTYTADKFDSTDKGRYIEYYGNKIRVLDENRNDTGYEYSSVEDALFNNEHII